MTSNDKKYNSNNPLQQYFIQHFLNTISNLAQKAQGSTLLEVGSGEGYLLEAILGKTNYQAIAFDKSSKALAKLHNKLPNVKIVQGDAANLPFIKDQFDLIVCCEMLEHLKDPKLALKELKRVGKQYFIFSVPDEPIFSLANLLRGKNISRFGNDVDHLQKWSFNSFCKLISQDFVIIESCRSFPWSIIFCEKK